MSLDLDGKSGRNTAGTFAAGLTAGPVNADFVDATVLTNANAATVFIDTTAGDVTVTMAQLDALTGVSEGDSIKLKKTSTDSNLIIFLDGDGATNSFVNRQYEYYCAVRRGAGDWEI